MKNRFSVSSDKKKIQLTGYLYILLFLVVSTAIQIIFKKVAVGPGGSDYLALIFDPLFYFCGIFFILQAATWLAVLRRLPLSHAYPFTSLTIITIMASGAVFFDEAITLGNLIGILLIIAGVTVIAGGNKNAVLNCTDGL